MHQQVVSRTFDRPRSSAPRAPANAGDLDRLPYTLKLYGAYDRLRA
jgi:hypothetical protein